MVSFVVVVFVLVCCTERVSSRWCGGGLRARARVCVHVCACVCMPMCVHCVRVVCVWTLFVSNSLTLQHSLLRPMMMMVTVACRCVHRRPTCATRKVLGGFGELRNSKLGGLVECIAHQLDWDSAASSRAIASLRYSTFVRSAGSTSRSNK